MTDLEIHALCARSMDLYPLIWNECLIIPDKDGNIHDTYGELTGTIYSPLLQAAQCFDLITKHFVICHPTIDAWYAEAYIELDPFPEAIRASHTDGHLNRAVCTCVAKLWIAHESNGATFSGRPGAL